MCSCRALTEGGLTLSAYTLVINSYLRSPRALCGCTLTCFPLLAASPIYSLHRAESGPFPRFFNLAFASYFEGPTGSFRQLRGEREVRLKRMDVQNGEVYKRVSAGALGRGTEMKGGAGSDVNTARLCLHVSVCVCVPGLHSAGEPSNALPTFTQHKRITSCSFSGV